MKNMTIKIFVILSALMLTACGGGGGGDENEPETPIDNGGVKNTAPSLSVSRTNFSINEGELTKINVLASDKEDTTSTFSVVSSSPSISILQDESDVTLMAGEVDVDTLVTLIFKTTDSGGLSKQVSINVTVLNVVPPIIVNNAPSITFSVEKIDVTEKTKQGFSLTVNDFEDGNLIEKLNYSVDSNLLTVSRTGDYISVDAKEVTEDSSALITFSVTDSQGLKATKVMQVNILNLIDETNTPPQLSIKDMDSNNSVIIYELKENILQVVISDSDSQNVSWEFKNIVGVEGSDFVMDFIERIEKVGDTLVIVPRQIPENSVLNFTLTLSATDGNTNIEEQFNLALTNVPNSMPLFVFKPKVGGFVPIPVGQTTTIEFSFIDDSPEDVKIDSFETWHGDDTKFTATLDKVNHTITINNHSLALGDEFGLLIKYNDKTKGGLTAVNFKSTIVMGSLQFETLDFVQEIYSKIEALNEYVYITEFYTEVLENLNYISEFESDEIIQKSLVSDSGNINTVRSLVGTLEAFVVWGNEDGQDQEWIDNYKQAINTQFDAAKLSYGSRNYTLINEMADKTDGLLPQIDYVSEIFEYDVENGKYSKFAGNPSYGVFEGNKFVFFSEFEFLEAIIAKTSDLERKVYSK